MKKLSFLAILIFVSSSLAHSADLAGCRPQLEKSLCYSLPVNHWTSDSDNLVSSLKSWQERKCSTVPANLKQTLLSVYDQYPKEIQKAFCEIKKVFIVSGEVSYGALADYYFDLATVKVQTAEWNPRFSGKPIGYVLEISEKNRFKGETGAAYFTRVLRARFGNASATPDQLPLAEYTDPFGTNGALATTIVHELGHMLGRAQKVTSTYFLPLSEGNWSKISFKLDSGSYSLRHALNDYEQRMGMKSLDLNDVQPTFDLFRKSGVATLYGATVPQEDLAEFFMLNYYGNLKWSVGGKIVFDLQKEMATNPAFKAKRDIIQNLMSLPEPFSLKNRGTVAGEIGAM
ncbi:MAG: hypothetical protein V4598_06355 [Bdellovibrionota bacterium]